MQYRQSLLLIDNNQKLQQLLGLQVATFQTIDGILYPSIRQLRCNSSVASFGGHKITKGTGGVGQVL
jgi:hypothetical protein